jgi:hypothetical protein
MMPAVPPPKSAAIRVPVELKLKRNYKYDSRKRVFVSGSGTSFDPHRDLPKDTRIVYKVPALAAADESGLSQPEKETSALHAGDPAEGVSPQDSVEMVRGWPSVEEASVGPDVSLPNAR